MRVVPFVVGILAAGLSAPAAGGREPQSIAPKLAATVNLENKRGLPLLHFEIVVPARDNAPEIVVGKLAQPLAAGETARVPLAGGSGCRFEARWAFEDVKDAGDVDLCNDARIVLVD